MSRARVEMDRLQELVRLHRMRTGAREVARLLGMGPNTERLYREALEAAGLMIGPVEDLPELEVLKAAVATHAPPKPKPQQTSSIEEWTERVRALMGDGLKARAIFDRLRLEQEPAFVGTYPAVRRLVASIGKAAGFRAEDVAIPVETEPGEVAQVDFGEVGRLFDPETQRLRRAWAFVMVLGFSRHMVVRVVFDQKVTTWLRLHVEAFEELGGVVRTVVPDNLKAAVIQAAFGVSSSTALNRSYRELARHYGFKVDPTPPYAPQKKGKVESGVKYVQGNFFRGRQGQPVSEVRQELPRWVNEIAGTRTHGTTGKAPRALFEEVEREQLLPLPATAFEAVSWAKVTVHRDSHIAYERRLYSVPWRLIGKEVWARVTESTVALYWEDTRVATHPRHGDSLRSTDEGHLPEHRGPRRHRSRLHWEERARALGPEVERYIGEVFDADPVLSPLRTVQAMVLHLETFPQERANAACRRARYYANYGFGGLKTILEKALDLEPLPIAVVPPTESQSKPRFARDVRELLHSLPEENHEPH
jgi:transposase